MRFLPQGDQDLLPSRHPLLSPDEDPALRTIQLNPVNHLGGAERNRCCDSDTLLPELRGVRLGTNAGSDHHQASRNLLEK